MESQNMHIFATFFATPSLVARDKGVHLIVLIFVVIQNIGLEAFFTNYVSHKPRIMFLMQNNAKELKITSVF